MNRINPGNGMHGAPLPFGFSDNGHGAVNVTTTAIDLKSSQPHQGIAAAAIEIARRGNTHPLIVVKELANTEAPIYLVYRTLVDLHYREVAHGPFGTNTIKEGMAAMDESIPVECDCETCRNCRRAFQVAKRMIVDNMSEEEASIAVIEMGIAALEKERNFGLADKAREHIAGLRKYWQEMTEEKRPKYYEPPVKMDCSITDPSAPSEPAKESQENHEPPTEGFSS